MYIVPSSTCITEFCVCIEKEEDNFITKTQRDDMVINADQQTDNNKDMN